MVFFTVKSLAAFSTICFLSLGLFIEGCVYFLVDFLGGMLFIYLSFFCFLGFLVSFMDNLFLYFNLEICFFFIVYFNWGELIIEGFLWFICSFVGVFVRPFKFNLTFLGGGSIYLFGRSFWRL